MDWNQYELNVLRMINLYRAYFTFYLEDIVEMFAQDSNCNNRSLSSIKNKLYRTKTNGSIHTSNEDFLPTKLLNRIKKQPYTIQELSMYFRIPNMFIISCIDYLQRTGVQVKINESSHVVYSNVKNIATQPIEELEDTPYVAVTNKQRIKFGIVADTHFGSNACNLDALNKFYDICLDNNVPTILHAGDIVDGIRVYKGQEFEQTHYGFDAQTNLVIDKYPYREGIQTYAILGNHDYSFISHSDSDPLAKICMKRKDIKHIGKYFGEIIIGDFLIALHHPDGGGAYALSYKAQKLLEAVSTYYDAYIVGHYHSAMTMYDYHSTWACLAGSFQNETMFARRKGMRTVIGGYIVTMEKIDGATVVTPKWINF